MNGHRYSWLVIAAEHMKFAAWRGGFSEAQQRLKHHGRGLTRLEQAMYQRSDSLRIEWNAATELPPSSMTAGQSFALRFI